MEWKLDNDCKIPIYQQVIDFIERRITYGELPPGSFLPSERKLAAHLHVNRSTVTIAYNELRAMGIVESTTGKGTRVSTHMWGVSPTLTPNWKSFVEGGLFRQIYRYFAIFGHKYSKMKILLISQAESSAVISFLMNSYKPFYVNSR